MHIDLHSHVIPPGVVERMVSSPRELAARVEGEGDARTVIHEQGYIYPLHQEFFDAGAKIESMNRRGIDLSVISPAPPLFHYWADRERAVRAARLVNDGVAAMVSQYPTRLRGMATIPLQHPDAAIDEMERVVREHGFKAIAIGTSIEGTQLADMKFRSVLRRAQELDVFLFAHPYYVGTRAGLECYYLTNLIGNPLDTAVMVAHLMYSGALDELDRLRVCLAHGGGFAPYQIGRLAHGHKVRRETRAQSASSPSELLRRFYFDALVFDPHALRFLIDLVGADRVCLGTDSPFDMADDDPLGTLSAVPGLTSLERHEVCCGTALRLLGEATVR
jgi:aminocarboxymuconate-semialdehyde decarboxylase